jgi:hypothetical protein
MIGVQCDLIVLEVLKGFQRLRYHFELDESVDILHDNVVCCLLIMRDFEISHHEKDMSR